MRKKRKRVKRGNILQYMLVFSKIASKHKDDVSGDIKKIYRKVCFPKDATTFVS